MDFTEGGVFLTPTDQKTANNKDISACYGCSPVTVFILTTVERNTTVTCAPQHMLSSTTCTKDALCLLTVKGKSKSLIIAFLH